MMFLVLGVALALTSQAASAPDPQAQLRLELQQRVTCQLVARKLAETATYLASPSISEDVIAAHAVADLLDAGGDWPKGTRAFIQSVNVTPAQLQPFEQALRDQIGQQTEDAQAIYFRGCQQAHGEPVYALDGDY